MVNKLLLIIIALALLAGCRPKDTPTPIVFPSATSTTEPAPATSTPEPATTTPEIFIPLTQAIPLSSPTASPTPEPTTTPVTTSTPDPNQGAGPLLYNDPLDGSSGWGWGFTEDGVVEFAVDNGAVVAEAFAANVGWRISIGPPGSTAGDQLLRLIANAEVCSGQDEWGFLFRGEFTDQDQFNGYVFKINCGGEVRVERLDENQSTALMGWTAVPAIKTGENTLMVWAGKDELRFYVNDTYIGSVKDSKYTAGVAGLYVQDRTNGSEKIRFEDILINQVIAP